MPPLLLIRLPFHRIFSLFMPLTPFFPLRFSFAAAILLNIRTSFAERVFSCFALLAPTFHALPLSSAYAVPSDITAHAAAATRHSTPISRFLMF